MNAEKQLLDAIDSAEYFIDKAYLDNLDDPDEYNRCEPVPISSTNRKDKLIRLFRIHKIIFDSNENVNDKMVNVFSALAPFVIDMILLVAGSKEDVRLYIGIKSKRDVEIAKQILHDSFMANFPGSTLSEVRDIGDSQTSFATLIDAVDKTSSHGPDSSLHVGCINVVPSLRGNKSESYIQGLERFIDTMRGEEYVCEIIATPLSQRELGDRLKGCEDLYSALSPFSKKSMAQGHNYGKTLAEGISESISSSISQGVSLSTGTSSGFSRSKQSGYNIGGSFLINLGFNQGTSEAVSSGRSSTTTDQKTETEQTGTTTSKTETVSTGTVDTITLEYKDKSIDNLLEKVDLCISRLKESASYGLWDCAAYIIAPQKKTVAIGSSTFKSLMLGENSHVERTHINFFGSEKRDITPLVLDSLRYCEHPRFRIPAGTVTKEQIIRSATAVSGKELAIFMAMPRRSVSGVLVSEMAEFGRNVFDPAAVGAEKVRIGNVYYMDQTERTPVELRVDSLTSHCFITGSTGSGKSNTMYVLLEKLSKLQRPVPFLVIEPAKGEYRQEFGGMPGINIFGTNAAQGQMLRLNPFYFDPAIHILEHLDRLVEIFNTCWEMYAAMPAILKDAIERTYTQKGWDLLNSTYIKKGIPTYPTFNDLLIELPRVINMSGYSSDTKGDYTGALVTRVQSLTNGLYGQIFCDDFDINEEVLFDQNTIIDLSRVGSAETKSLIMGMIVLRLTEYRMARPIPANAKLRHITVLEEAHNLLKNTNNIRSTAGNQVVAKSVEMIVNSIAEMRTYGEGFFIVDQSPTSVDISAIKNTNTKIIMRLPEEEDCDLAGKSVSLSEKQILELSKLKVGIAVVMQNNWTEAVLSKIECAGHQYQCEYELTPLPKLKEFRSTVLTALLEEYALSESYDLDHILEEIERFDIRRDYKKEMAQYIRALCTRMDQNFDSLVFGRSIKRLSGCSDAFKISAQRLKRAPDSADGVRYTPESVSAWKESIRNNIGRFVSLEERVRDILIQYIVHSQRFERHEINYDVLYNEIYQVR